MRTSNSAPENNQDYTIVDQNGDFHEGCAVFMYKGHEISYSTFGYKGSVCLHPVVIYKDNKPVGFESRFHTVEDAIDWINSQG